MLCTVAGVLTIEVTAPTMHTHTRPMRVSITANAERWQRTKFLWISSWITSLYKSTIRNSVSYGMEHVV